MNVDVGEKWVDPSHARRMWNRRGRDHHSSPFLVDKQDASLNPEMRVEILYFNIKQIHIRLKGYLNIRR